MNRELRNIARAVAKKLSFLPEREIARNLDAMGATLVEAYKAGAEEAQDQILERLNGKLLQAAQPPQSHPPTGEQP